MDVRVDDKVALVTGASRGIGEAIAAELLSSGARGVVITSRKPDNIEAAAERLGEPDRVLAVVAKADEPEHAADAVARAVGHFGVCDILVNNAGTSPAVGSLATVDLGAVQKTWAVNQFGPLLYAREAWNQWMEARGGAIVNIASIAGLEPSAWLGAYNVSKAGVIHLTRQLAHEMAPTVRVNAVAPAVVRTQLAEALWKDREAEAAAAHPLARIGEPSDIANAVVFLASDAASWITGVTLPVDGGATGASGGTLGQSSG